MKLYLPASLLFFIIGTCLYVYYQENPELIQAVRLSAAAERLPSSASASEIARLAATLKPAEYGDKVMPHFIVTELPVGLIGLIVAAILSAAMSTISSGMNASATVFLEDIYKRYINYNITEKQQLRLLYISTTVVGLLAILCGIAMIGVKSILDLWWELSGIFAGGMLGLFLLGLISKKTGNAQALTATICGILVILWLTFSKLIPDHLAFLRSGLHANMVIVVGTLVIYFTGLFLTWLKPSANTKSKG